jgi:flagellar basal-body rod protein FlgB
MLSNIKLLDTMSAMAGHAARRHAVIADNIANADTPNFKAKDLQPFAQVFGAAERGQQNIKSLHAQTIEMETGDVASPNGNTVSLEQQMMLSVQTKGDHDMALAVYKKSLDMMKMALGKNL